MTEYDALRREIEIRINRETIYHSIEALNTKESLRDRIEDNDKHIKLIGEYLRGMEVNSCYGWEKFYKENYKQ